MNNSISSKTTQSGVRSTMPAFGAFPTNRASFLLQKTNPALGRSTPDSEVLASSDDEAEHLRTSQQVTQPKVASVGTRRRTSWLHEMPQAYRKSSIPASGTYSPSTSHPATPSAEQGSWNANASPSLTGAGAWNANSSYPWGSGSIWNDTRKDPPARLQQVLPSPRAMVQPPKFLSDETGLHLLNQVGGDASLPFSIPLQPTPKTYRSQSYSVGQLDTGAVIPSTMAIASPLEAPRSRFGPTAGSLQRRSSRQGGFGDRGLDTGGLGRVTEDDDDAGDLPQHDYPVNRQAEMISKLERENAELRHAAQERGRTASTSADLISAAFCSMGSQIMPTTADLAVDDVEDIQHASASFERRGDGSTLLAGHAPQSSVEVRGGDGARKAHWQTSLGFGHFDEPPQSRRHSFTEAPTRHGSISSTGEPNRHGDLWNASNMTDRNLHMRSFESMTQDNGLGKDPSYFINQAAMRRQAEEKVGKAFAANNPFGRYTGVGNAPTPAQSLYIVNFKCNRSDVFYIQEGTGLTVTEGDLVIVEADRGTDLGAIQHANVSWEQARYYKEHYAEEHYKLLMMFSMQARNGGPNVVNPNGLQGQSASAVGGMGPPGHHGGHDTPHGDLKPKMIKRHAQQHEIQALQEKEGNEAKAKRVCQQKVVDHGLNMEILDAEFQMDSKKLTFYYFADNYINFNPLVTDLFKIYKTRIWMSAINPASFVTPTASLAPTGYAGYSVGRQSPSSRRGQQRNYGYGQSGQQMYGDSFEQRSNQRATPRPQYYDGYNNYSSGTQHAAYGMGPYNQAAVDPFAPYMGYQMLNANAPNFAPQNHDARNRGNHQGSNGDWMGRFQNMSLGS